MSASPNPALGLLPLDPERAARLEDLIGDLDPAMLLWVSGYTAGLATERTRALGRMARTVSAVESVAPALGVATARVEETRRATVLYASQTGNGRRVAERLGRSLEAAGVAVQVLNIADYPPRQLPQERLLYLVASTHGDGDPPDDARAFVDHLTGRRASRLELLAFSVLALGDSSYPQFCATGRLFDGRLAELGARRLAPLVECDVDFESKAAAWLDTSLGSARAEAGGEPPRLTIVTTQRPAVATLASRDSPVEVELVANQRITARDAVRDVRHLELALPGDRFAYEPGDAIGLVVGNPSSTVDHILAVTRLDPAHAVTVDGVTRSVGQWLTGHREVARVARPLIEELARRGGHVELAGWLDPSQATQFRRRLKEVQVADLLKRFPAEWESETLVRALHPLAPRLYSVASSRREVGEEAHLTVAVVDYQYGGERRVGPASWQLATALRGARIKAYVEENPRFRVPSDGERDVIMIGPGTGVAPFRGFVQQRAADGARGRNWLLFGGRNRERDFLYQVEWQEALKRRSLSRLDAAFSRDQANKVYVQDRLRERGAEVYAWLEGGAHLYVCGDAEQMAPDVHAALLEIVATHGGRSPEDAADYLSELARTRRYARDVY